MAKRTVVIKVGSSSVTTPGGGIDTGYIGVLCDQAVAVRERGYKVVIVSSGAIAAGIDALGLAERPADMPTLQACAAIGQVRLVDAYRAALNARGALAAQVLITRHDVGHRQAYLNACHTLERLLELGIVPIVNENDTTAVEEIRFGDNDYLAALVGMMVHAELVVLLTDTQGLYSADPRLDAEARLLERVDQVTDEHMAAAGGPGSTVGSGGMATKLEAARALMKAGIPLVICDAKRPDVVVDAVAGEPVGTLFAGGAAAVKGRKLWLAYAGHPKGSIVIDDGAKEALCSRGKSLLPAGVVDVSGSFVVGDPIAIEDRTGAEIARGLAGMTSEELRKVKGLKSHEVAEALPGRGREEVVHRDHLVIL